MRHSSKARVKTYAILFMTLSLSGCFQRQQSGVSLKSLTADLVFGIPPVEEPAAPANFGDLPSTELQPVVVARPRPGPTGGGPAIDPCPDANPTDFPEEAGTEIVGRVKEGDYRWAIQGEENVPGVGKHQKDPFTPKRIQGIRVINPTNYEYTIKENDLRFGSAWVIYTTYRVVNDQGGDPNGLYLVRIIRQMSDTSSATFSPTPAMRILPTPTQPGEPVDVTGVDPTTLEVLQIKGSVQPRERIDACGKLVDAWVVKSEQDFTTSRGDSFSRYYDYGIASQFGGMLVLERIKSPRNDPRLIINGRVGQDPTSPTTV